MRFRLIVITLLCALVALIAVGCATKQQAGAAIGAGTGAAVGSYVTGSEWGAIAGGALGAFAGSRIGAELDRRDRERFIYAMREVPPGQEYEWRNPDTGAYWEVTPRATYQAPQGYPCREFVMRGHYHDEDDQMVGTACQQPDGTWEVVG